MFTNILGKGYEMIVLQILEYYNAKGGLGTHVNHLSNTLNNFDIDTIIIALQSQYESGWDGYNSKVLWIKMDKRYNYSMGEKRNYSDELSLLETKIMEIYELLLMRVDHVDIINAHSDRCYSIGVPLASALGCPSVLTLHGSHFYYPLSRCMNCSKAEIGLICNECEHISKSDYLVAKLYFFRKKISLIASDRVFVLNSRTYDLCTKYYGINQEKVSLIKHWVDIPSEKTLEILHLQGRNKWIQGIDNNDNRVILWVGAEREHKRLDIVLQAFDMLHREDDRINLWLVGISDRYFLNKSNGLSQKCMQRIHCIGTLNSDELSQVYAAANCLWLPSIWEAASYIFLEALAYRLPVIASEGSNQKDFLFDEENVLLIPKNNSVALAEKTKELFHSNQKIERIKRHGTAYLYNNHDVLSCSAHIINEYLKTIKIYKKQRHFTVI